MEQFLIPDLSATETYTLPRLLSSYALIVAENVLAAAKDKKAKKDARALVKEAKEELKNPPKDPSGRTITIGYLPGPIRSKLRHQAQDLYSKAKPPKGKERRELTPEEKDRDREISRDWVKWGVKGHENLGVDFETEDITVRGRPISVASEDMVELYELSGLLMALESVIVYFNSLGAKKKTS